jgi:hypothetical protein
VLLFRGQPRVWRTLPFKGQSLRKKRTYKKRERRNIKRRGEKECKKGREG